MTITNKEPLDCTHLPAGKVLNYYTHGIEIWMPFDRWMKFLVYINQNGIIQHEGKIHYNQDVKGLTIKRIT